MKTQDSTRAVHGGETKRKAYDSLTTPIVQTSTYAFADTAAIISFLEQKAARKVAREAGGDLPLRGEYGRYSNPTILTAEGKLAALEGADHAALFTSGMNAITTTLLAFLSGGDHAVVIRDIYKRTREFAETYLPRWGIETTLVNIDAPAELEAALRPNTRMIFTETPTNPYLRILDLSFVASIARDKGILTAVDSTFATPINMRPLELGIDLVIHSATKYLAGHNDLLAGVVLGNHSLLSKVEEMRGMLGGLGDPHNAYLLLRGLKTLALRVRQQNANGLKVAQFLEGHPEVERVYYPGLPSHPDHEIAKRQMTGFGGVVSFDLAGDKDKTSRFVDRLRIPYIGPTLGGVEGIVQQQALFVSLDEGERLASGLTDNLVRYALGIEDAEDIIADLAQALRDL